ncbi:FAD-dependent oxidoreductase, partial [Clavibacter michiganensis]|uniref:FAD-dependent oxidoreductase n=1 Tax=Clavibacter michiganensis TaxID=28447 RepID=UPI00292D3C3F
MDGQHEHQERRNREKPPVTQAKTTDLGANIARSHDRPSAQVLVIGGGINGIATSRDLALQGIDVVLVERADYGSGASPPRPHTIHGRRPHPQKRLVRPHRHALAARPRPDPIPPH